MVLKMTDEDFLIFRSGLEPFGKRGARVSAIAQQRDSDEDNDANDDEDAVMDGEDEVEEEDGGTETSAPTNGSCESLAPSFSCSASKPNHKFKRCYFCDQRYTCMHTRTYIHTCMQHMQACIYIYTKIREFINAHLHAHIHICLHIFIYFFIYFIY